jgi:acyl carrier protein
MNSDIFNEIRLIFLDILQCDEAVIHENSSANEIVQWDSLAHINLVIAIERKFGMKFALGELQDLKNIKDLVNLVESKL